jgi:LL-diaminopimelate aminotransferase
MKTFELSSRLKKLPPYLFAEIDRKKNELKKKWIRFFDLSIGDPDILAPKKVIDTLYKEAKLKENQKYALDEGKLSLRKAIKKWFKKRFKVNLNEEKEILPLIGSKEGLVHFPLGIVNRGDYIIIPSPSYPGYRGAAIFSDAKIYTLPLLEKNDFLPDFKRIPLSVRNKARIIYLNYPNNPTTKTTSYQVLKEWVKFCVKYGIIIAYDNAYSEIYFEEKPLSLLEIEQAKEVTIEFHSFSKTFCMTGFRVGWAVGNQNLIKILLKVKTNIDSGIFGAIQEAARMALEEENDFVKKLRKIFKERRDVFVKGLKEKGFKDLWAQSTFYVWAKIPSSFTSSIDYVKYLLEKKKIVATPGVGFGKYGEGFVRFALTCDKKILEEVIKIL